MYFSLVSPYAHAKQNSTNFYFKKYFPQYYFNVYSHTIIAALMHGPLLSYVSFINSLYWLGHILIVFLNSMH